MKSAQSADLFLVGPTARNSVTPIIFMQAVIISSSKLPNRHTEIFPSSTFFRQGTEPQQLPRPPEVKAQAALINHVDVNAWRPPPVVFPDLNLLVKYGGAVSIAEGQCLWMIRTYLGHKVSVPEVYGWCRDGEETFVYMELIKGSTLEQRWNELSTIQRFSICDQLRPIVAALETLKQSPCEICVGNIISQPLQDIIFDGLTVGPFPNASIFNDWFTQPNWAQTPSNRPLNDIHPLRRGLPDDSIGFVHGDLHRSNILITSEGQQPPRVLAIIDWHQSGWYPAYWEYCKTRWTVEPGDEWVTKYIPEIMQARAEAYHSFNYFCLCHGE